MPEEPDVLKRFGIRLRSLRSERGYSQEDFALDVGLDRTYVSGIERGKRNVSLRNLERIAKQLDMSLSQLFEDV